MTSELSKLHQALLDVPVFPLPQAVLFPEALLPLHIFEPRYRVMIRDVLAGHGVMAVAQIEPSTARLGTDDSSPDSQPTIASIAGAGFIVDHAELPSGRFNILVKGYARVSLVELPFVSPYRRARATIIAPTEDRVPASDLTALVSSASAFVSAVRESDKDFTFRLPKGASPSVLADMCAHHLVLDGQLRQRLLETAGARERVRLVIGALATQQAALSPASGPLN